MINVVAHRGLWGNGSEKNSIEAFVAAAEAGFGIELDVRMEQGSRGRRANLVVSHDNPPEWDAPKFWDVVERLVGCQRPRSLFIDVKEDGLLPKLEAQVAPIAKAGWRVYAFDMSAAEEWLFFQKKTIPYLARLSEFEEPRLPGNAGVWIDGLSRDFPGPEEWARIPGEGVLAFVSPELHGRDPFKAWETIFNGLMMAGDREAYICTDRPREAREFFRGLP